MKSTNKKRILRMVILDLCAFCVLSYLICAQVFHFFPWKPVQIVLAVIVMDMQDLQPAPHAAYHLRFIQSC